ncbi:MAG: ISAzo13 family transposase, partial [Planctomycetaceae bacterium]|nr:ISAzo13 family transposase [Planctomycetaceae bacterium]
HRLFSYISKNWRGRPLIDLATVINLIANTKTETGLTVRCVEDKKLYKKGIKINDYELKKIDLKPAPFLGNWNYSIKSKNK